MYILVPFILSQLQHYIRTMHKPYHYLYKGSNKSPLQGVKYNGSRETLAATPDIPPDPPSNLEEPIESISSIKMIDGACSLQKPQQGNECCGLACNEVSSWWFSMAGFIRLSLISSPRFVMLNCSGVDKNKSFQSLLPAFVLFVGLVYHLKCCQINETKSLFYWHLSLSSNHKDHNNVQCLSELI